MSKKVRPYGYWNDAANILAEHREFMKKHGLKNVPGDKFLRRSGASSLAHARERYPGGARQLRIDLGEKEDGMPRRRNTWKDWENVKKALEDLTKRFGYFPTEKEIAGTEYGSLHVAIRAYHGKFPEVRKRFMEETGREQEKKLAPRDKWPDFDSWKAYGVGQGYNQKNPHGLQKSKDEGERKWYLKGQNEEWVKDFEFKRIKRKPIFNSLDDWIEHGISNGYDERTHVSLVKSEDRNERYWYEKGHKNGWLREFSFGGKRSDPDKLEFMLDEYIGVREDG